MNIDINYNNNNNNNINTYNYYTAMGYNSLGLLYIFDKQYNNTIKVHWKKKKKKIQIYINQNIKEKLEKIERSQVYQFWQNGQNHMHVIVIYFLNYIIICLLFLWATNDEPLYQTPRVGSYPLYLFR